MTNRWQRGHMDMQACFTTITLEISPERIYWLKFLLEGEEGLAGQSTVDKKNGRVAVYCAPERILELKRFLHINGPSFGLTWTDMDIA